MLIKWRIIVKACGLLFIYYRLGDAQEEPQMALLDEDRIFQLDVAQTQTRSEADVMDDIMTVLFDEQMIRPIYSLERREYAS